MTGLSSGTDMSSLFKKVRRDLIQNLWQFYKNVTPEAALLEDALAKHNETLVLDHCAIIDLPSPHSGMNKLAEIFTAIGFTVQGRDYLPEKQNDFLWMAEIDAHEREAIEVLPQIVLADFRLEELAPHVRATIEKYTRHINKSIVPEVHALCREVDSNNIDAAKRLVTLLSTYLTRRDWPLPTLADFKMVAAANELIAWVLVFGRCPNHFTIGVHLLKNFNTLGAFNDFATEHLQLNLNKIDNIIKGAPHMGIEQSSTLGAMRPINLNDGQIELPGYFVEFVWRHAKASHPPIQWQDYFTGFIAGNANRVVESLYDPQ
jgi:Domain of unknown function (DUF1338)